MKKLILLFALLFSGCVTRETAVAYAQRAHPECHGIIAITHAYSSGHDGLSLTEVSMDCGGPSRRSITIKCDFNWGCISDTTCYENN